ncbi:hypothetical protein PR048_024586 [Dryococelus australis]|uniref:Uncharacterized protein n=1 Tax=Dryococelus australis TaxID=614101 RepID=A0ABQ9GNZ0_9NEOP|nr:hypothetical protein PR048_024586 [Dryococelus australis]
MCVNSDLLVEPVFENGFLNDKHCSVARSISHVVYVNGNKVVPLGIINISIKIATGQVLEPENIFPCDKPVSVLVSERVFVLPNGGDPEGLEGGCDVRYVPDARQLHHAGEDVCRVSIGPSLDVHQGHVQRVVRRELHKQTRITSRSYNESWTLLEEQVALMFQTQVRALPVSQQTTAKQSRSFYNRQSDRLHVCSELKTQEHTLHSASAAKEGSACRQLIGRHAEDILCCGTCHTSLHIPGPSSWGRYDTVLFLEALILVLLMDLD